MISPTSGYIPIDTELTKDQFMQLKGIIESKQKKLSKLKQWDTELSLWYMEQIEYLNLLYHFNVPRFIQVKHDNL